MNIERIEQFIENEGISVRSFENTIGTSNGVIRRAIKNKTDIQSKWITAMLENYPHLSSLWILTGKGEMLLSKNEKDISSAEKTMACKKCESLEQENNYLKQIIESKDETIRAYQSISNDKNNGDYRTIA